MGSLDSGPGIDGRCEARAALARMNRLEEFAQNWDRFEDVYAHEIEPRAVTAMTMHYANTYHRLVGVHPAERHELRRKVEHLLGDGGVPPSLGASSQANGGSGLLSAGDLFA